MHAYDNVVNNKFDINLHQIMKSVKSISPFIFPNKYAEVNLLACSLKKPIYIIICIKSFFFVKSNSAFLTEEIYKILHEKISCKK